MQLACSQDHLLPEEYVVTFRETMLDKCPSSTFSQVVNTIVAELGAPPSKLFAEFEEEPIAAASLAQVSWPYIAAPASPLLSVMQVCPQDLRYLSYRFIELSALMEWNSL